ncbi:MAG TPA: FAD/NAD(P)-binding oxidoreductase [Mycobacteriales bacterium]|nr:FAD/NAD(P)-binding oxidoreductase [Mycobacteriales bacterium]
MSPTAVVVGTSIGGIRTAQALRRNDYPGDIVLLGEETELPYDKPPLSKELLAGTSTTERVRLLAEDAADQHFRVLLGRRAEALDIANHAVVTDEGPVRYDHLVIATGARARPSPWGDGPGIHLLRTMSDAQQLRQTLADVGSLLVVGGGFIGAEVASTAQHYGVEVTLVDPLERPLGRAVGPTMGQLLCDLHHRHGVATHFGAGVESVTPAAHGLQVVATDDTSFTPDAVLVAIGAVPNDDWLQSSGLLVDNGVICDEHCRAAGASDIYAVGDVARWFHPRHEAHTRVEHWTNAVEQALCVAHNICHPDELRTYAPVEYVWSDQYDWKLQFAGRTDQGGHEVQIGDVDTDGRLATLYGDADGELIGAATINWPKAMATCRRRLLDRVSVDEMREALGPAGR